MKVYIGKFPKIGWLKKLLGLNKDKPRPVKIVIDVQDTWNLDRTLAPVLAESLRKFKEHNNGYPDGLTMDIWNQYLDQMIEAFDLIYNGEEITDSLIIETRKGWTSNDYRIAETTRWKRINEGLRLFAKYYSHLWW